MAKTAATPDAILQAGLRLAADRGWRSLTLGQVAEEAGLPLSEVLSHVPTVKDLVMTWGRQVDAAVLAEDVVLDPRDSVKDRLFDLLMRRFDALAENKAAVGALLRMLPGDPLLGGAIGLSFARSMAMTLEAAGVPSSGLQGLVKTNGLVAIWLLVLRTWLSDDSDDLTATMAALDKALLRAEGWAGTLFRAKGRDRPDESVYPSDSPDSSDGADDSASNG